MIAPGTVLQGRYEIVDLISDEGGMATVWRVRDTTLGRQAALKVLNPGFREDADMRQRFLREAQICAQVKDRSIVQVLDVVSTEDVAGLIMELVSGESLNHRLARGPMSTEDILAVMEPVLRAMWLAHNRGIVHRDLKPSNIMITKDAQGIRPVVLDFGVAKVKAQAQLDHNMKLKTDAGTVIGTVNYMSPEQIKGLTELDERSDFWSLGAILYEMATGEVAYDGPTSYAIQEKIVHARYPRPENAHPAVQHCVEKAMQVEPGDRFRDCQQFLDELLLARLPVAEYQKLKGDRQKGRTVVEKKKAKVADPHPTPAPPATPAPPIERKRKRRTVREEKKSGRGIWPIVAGVSVVALLVLGLAGAGGIVGLGGLLGILAINEDEPVIVEDEIGAVEVRPDAPDTKPATERVVEPPTPPPPPKNEYTSPSSRYSMVRVKAGSFTMGALATDENAQADEVRKAVEISRDFFIGKYEVTNAVWSQLRPWNPSTWKSNDLPVQGMTWKNTLEFCNDLSIADSLDPVYTIRDDYVAVDWNANGYRLPTEAEWAFAARGGGEEYYRWSGSDSWSSFAWVRENSGAKPHAVGGKYPNGLGLYDMSGNVYEWVWDWSVCNSSAATCGSQYDRAGGTRDPRGPEMHISNATVKRGGSWKQAAASARVSNHAYYKWNEGYSETGFRMVRNAD